MTALLRALARLAALVLGLLAAGVAPAHEISMAELQLSETARGQFLWQWTAGLRTSDDELRPVWPASCRAEPGVVRCGETGLTGQLGIDGVGKRFSAVLVKVTWLDGRNSVFTLTAGQPEVQVFGAADDRRGWTEIGRAYLVLGVQHILAGIDHLLFVLALLFLVGFRRQLVLTITAFTVAHSVTLVLSALGLLTLRPPPVEATIALSILLVAGEALHDRPTLSRRWPALVALLFGLVHGLGFAGALAQIGLPQHHLPVALLSFNLGVEAGQLLVVLAAWALHTLLARWPRAALARRPVLYGIGGMAAFWTIERVVAMAG